MLKGAVDCSLEPFKIVNHSPQNIFFLVFCLFIQKPLQKSYGWACLQYMQAGKKFIEHLVPLRYILYGSFLQ